MIEDMLGKIYCEDCLETMSRMEDKSIDLIVTSPPYNMGGKSLGCHPRSTIGDRFYSAYSDNLSSDEYVDFCRRVIMESLRVSRYVFWNVQWTETTRYAVHDIHKTFSENMKDIFVWHKQAVAQIARGRTASGHEFVFMLGENGNRNFAYHNFPDNGYVPNIQTWYKKESFREHHATFPVELPLYFVEYFTKPNDIVYDPFLGSGTTAVACERLHREWIGSEIDPAYVTLAEKRIAAERAQMKMVFK